MVFILQRAEYLLKCEIQFFMKSFKLYYNKFSLYADNKNNNLISGLESTEKIICLSAKYVPKFHKIQNIIMSFDHRKMKYLLFYFSKHG